MLLKINARSRQIGAPILTRSNGQLERKASDWTTQPSGLNYGRPTKILGKS
jgi:hypothetical protein